LARMMGRTSATNVTRVVPELLTPPADELATWLELAGSEEELTPSDDETWLDGGTAEEEDTGAAEDGPASDDAPADDDGAREDDATVPDEDEAPALEAG